MEFNLPIINQLTTCQNLLIAGMGGGFDIFCGLPIYFELKKRGKNVHLANFSFSDVENLSHSLRLSPTLVGVSFDPNWLYPDHISHLCSNLFSYFWPDLRQISLPEGHLSQLFG